MKKKKKKKGHRSEIYLYPLFFNFTNFFNPKRHKKVGGFAGERE